MLVINRVDGSTCIQVSAAIISRLSHLLAHDAENLFIVFSE